MAILDFNTPTASTPPRSGRASVPAADRPKANIWLNIGYDVNGKFINLPLGMPLDTMEAAEVRGQNPDFIKQRTSQNALLKALQDAGAALAPGQEEVVNLVIKMRRVNEELVVDEGTNEYAVDFSALVGSAHVVAAE